MKRTELKRKTRLRPVNPKRRAETFARNFGDRGAAVRRMPCLVQIQADRGSLGWLHFERCQGDVQACHAIARGMGGAKGDRRSLVPLCAGHHAESGERGTSQRADFEARYSIRLLVVADAIAVNLDRRGLA